MFCPPMCRRGGVPVPGQVTRCRKAGDPVMAHAIKGKRRMDPGPAGEEGERRDLDQWSRSRDEPGVHSHGSRIKDIGGERQNCSETGEKRGKEQKETERASQSLPKRRKEPKRVSLSLPKRGKKPKRASLPWAICLPVHSSWYTPSIYHSGYTPGTLPSMHRAYTQGGGGGGG